MLRGRRRRWLWRGLTGSVGAISTAALGFHPSEKYQSDGGPTPADIVARLRQVSSDADADVERFLLSLGYNWLIVGTDAHAKNYSLLIADNLIRLAPLYDVASALPYADVHLRRRRLAMTIGSTYRPDQVRYRHFVALADAVGVDGDRPVQGMRRLVDAAGAAFIEVTEECGSDECTALTMPILEWIRTCQRTLR